MYRQRSVAAILVAAGASSRMGFDKMFHRINGVEVLRLAAAQLDEHPYIDELIVVGGANLGAVQALFSQYPTAKPLQIVLGGENRADSVAAGLAACTSASLVAVHDGARPFVGPSVISRAVEAAADCGAAAPAIPVKDTIKRVTGEAAKTELVAETLPRDALRAVQTPQVFDRATFARAMASLPPAQRAVVTDDCAVMERMGMPVRLVPGDEANLKITTPADLQVALAVQEGFDAPDDVAYDMATAGGAPYAAQPPAGVHDTLGIQSQPPRPSVTRGVRYSRVKVPALPRIGHGYDVHKLVAGRRLVLGGTDIPHGFGLLGHSDADVLAHAVSDALLGAAALGDIGRHFPDTDPNYAGANSIELLRQVGQLVGREGYNVGNIDATLLCQAPKLAPYIGAMRQNLADALCIDIGCVSVKATTEEGLGFTGSGQGIAAHCVAVLQPVKTG